MRIKNTRKESVNNTSNMSYAKFYIYYDPSQDLSFTIGETRVISAYTEIALSSRLVQKKTPAVLD